MTLTNPFIQGWQNYLARLIPGQLVVQLTDRCNAKCPQCSMRITEKFKRHTLPRQTVEKTIKAAGVKGIKAISFTGGEPFLMLDDLLAYIRLAGESNIPFIRTGTNGYYFSNSHKPGFSDKIHRLADQLAQTPLRNFWISIDSVDPLIHSEMRGFDLLFEGILKALPVFESAGVYPSVNLGINKNIGGGLTHGLSKKNFSSAKDWEKAVYDSYCLAFSKFYDTVIDLGFTIANACYPMSIETDSRELNPVYQASAQDHIIQFTREEKKIIFSALSDTIPKYRSRIRIFSPQASLSALVKEYSGQHNTSHPCLGGISYFFIDAVSGDTYPCGYRGKDNSGPFHRFKPAAGIQGKPCRKCDWECFRDPSEMIGPLIDLFSAPHRLAKKIFTDPEYFKVWTKDLSYYRACDFFNGRKPLNPSKLERFAQPEYCRQAK